MANGTVTVTQEQYDDFQRDTDTLNALYAAGVDNWKGYQTAMESM